MAVREAQCVADPRWARHGMRGCRVSAMLPGHPIRPSKLEVLGLIGSDQVPKVDEEAARERIDGGTGGGAAAGTS